VKNIAIGYECERKGPKREGPFLLESDSGFGFIRKNFGIAHPLLSITLLPSARINVKNPIKRLLSKS